RKNGTLARRSPDNSHRSPVSSSHTPIWQHHVLNKGRSTPMNTLAPSIRACPTASGTNRRSRRYKSVWKTVLGTDDKKRKVMYFESKVKGMKECCAAQTSATDAIARPVLRPRTLKRGSR